MRPPGRQTSFLIPAFATAGFAIAGFARAGLASAGFASAGFARAALATAGFEIAAFAIAGFDSAGITLPGVAEPATGVLATRAFFVVFRELISDFFWIVIFLAPRVFFGIVNNDAVACRRRAKTLAFTNNPATPSNQRSYKRAALSYVEGSGR